MGRSLSGLEFRSIFINGMKMQRDMPIKQGGKKRIANNPVRLTGGKKYGVSMRFLLRQHLKQQRAFWAPNVLIWREFMEE